jgi:hypothetical protein
MEFIQARTILAGRQTVLDPACASGQDRTAIAEIGADGLTAGLWNQRNDGLLM